MVDFDYNINQFEVMNMFTYIVWVGVFTQSQFCNLEWSQREGNKIMFKEKCKYILLTFLPAPHLLCDGSSNLFDLCYIIKYLYYIALHFNIPLEAVWTFDIIQCIKYIVYYIYYIYILIFQ